MVWVHISKKQAADAILTYNSRQARQVNLWKSVCRSARIFRVVCNHSSVHFQVLKNKNNGYPGSTDAADTSRTRFWNK